MTSFQMNETDMLQRHIRPLAPVPTGMAPDLSGMGRFSALVFDVYGTLLISAAGDIGHAGPAGFPGAELAEMLTRRGVRRSAGELARELKQAIQKTHLASKQDGIAFPEVDIVQIWGRILGMDDPARVRALAMEYELIINPVYPMPGLLALLTGLSKKGVVTGIVSNAQFYTPLVLEHFIGPRCFKRFFHPDLVFFSYEYGMAKPSAALFEMAAKAISDLNIPPSSVLYVGNDMKNDIQPAKKAGFRAALFAGDRRSLRLGENG